MNTDISNQIRSLTRNSIRVYLRLAAVGLLALCAACADLRWQKAGAGPETVEKDFDQCHRTATVRATRETWSYGATVPPTGAADYQGRATMRQQPPEIERSLLEHDLTRECMLMKGYILAPVGKPAAQP